MTGTPDTAVSQAFDFMEKSSGYLLWFAGAVLLLDAVFEIGSLTQVADHPRVFIFSLGIVAFFAGSLARDSQKKASRLERKLERCKEERDEYRELAFDPESEE